MSADACLGRGRGGVFLQLLIRVCILGVTCDGKWFAVEPTEMPVAEAASQVLAIRLGEVQRLLPLAAQDYERDVEFVHQLRVSCRRAGAALRAFKPLMGKRGRKLSRWLRRLRRAAGPARDADVLLARLRSELDLSQAAGEQLLDHVQRQRSKAQRKLVAADAKAAGGGLQRAAEKALRALSKADRDRGGESFERFAAAALQRTADPLVAADAHTATMAELHELRIAAKRLRYGMEIFQSARPELRNDVYPLVEELQDRLGAINDRVAAQQRFQRLLSRLPATEMGGFVAAAVVAECAAAERLRDEFLQWWSADRKQELHERLSTDLPRPPRIGLPSA